MSREPCFATEFRCGEEALVLSQVRLPEQEDLDLTVLRPVIPWAAPLEDAPSLAALERSHFESAQGNPRTKSPPANSE